MTDKTIRLQKFMAEQGIASRRKCEEMISLGKVKVNGHPAIIGQKIDPRRDIVTIGKQKIKADKSSKKLYIMLNKPRGYITSVSDNFDRKTVMDLLDGLDGRIYPVGRLDRDSEGLLLLTNDGEFTNLLTHPSHELKKTYRVTVREQVDDKTLLSLRRGTVIDGKKAVPDEITVITEGENRTVLEFVIHEGRNREIRKMCKAQNLNIIRLKRTAIGSLKLGMLKVGKYRELTDSEVNKLTHGCLK